MKYSPYSLLVLIFLLFFSKNNYAQGPGSLFVDAGLDTLIPCGTGGCADITADYLEIFETFSTNYTVASIPYSPDNSGNPPFPFNGLANNGILIIQDKMFNDTKFIEDLFSSLPNTFEHSQYSSIVATKHNQKINIAHYSDIIFNELKSENSSRNDVVNILQKK